MQGNKIVIARLILSFDGRTSSRAGIIDRLDKDRFKTVIIYLTKCSEAEDYFQSRGYSVHYLCGNTRLNAFRFSILGRLVKILKQEKVDIIHCHRHKPVVYGAIAGWITGVKVIAHVHGLNRSKKSRRRRINKLLFKKVCKILTVGQSVREDVLRDNPFLPDDKVVSIGNSIDIERFVQTDISKENAKRSLGFDSSVCVIGTVGRLNPTKDYATLIRSFKTVKERIANAELVMIGDGRLDSELKELAESLGVAASVHFLGRRSDLAELYRAMDVFALSSVAEGMPRVLIEAMACCVPCVATNVGGVPEVLENGNLGLLVDAGKPDDLAAAIVQMVNLPENDKRILTDKAKQKTLDDFSHEVVISRLEKIYEQVSP